MNPYTFWQSFLQEPTMDTELEYEEGVLMAAADYNIFMASELEDEPPAADPGPQDDGAADDSHLWEYADRTEKNWMAKPMRPADCLSPDGAVLRAGSTLHKIWWAPEYSATAGLSQISYTAIWGQRPKNAGLQVVVWKNEDM